MRQISPPDFPSQNPTYIPLSFSKRIWSSVEYSLIKTEGKGKKEKKILRNGENNQEEICLKESQVRDESWK